MNSSVPSESVLADAIASATELAAKKLFAQHPGHYYYLSLITTGEAHAPVLAAWSEEALEEAVRNEADKEDSRWGLKWSYADSPYFCFGEEYFENVNTLFTLRPKLHELNEIQSKDEYELRLRAMESAIAMLDRRGIFSQYQDRDSIIVNVEVMPPDFTNTLRAMRLNPPEAIRTWIEEIAEPVP
jgi:hypothetical protein